MNKFTNFSTRSAPDCLVFFKMIASCVFFMPSLNKNRIKILISLVLHIDCFVNLLLLVCQYQYLCVHSALKLVTHSSSKWTWASTESSCVSEWFTRDRLMYVFALFDCVEEKSKYYISCADTDDGTVKSW